jgi:hypothetical protein
MFLRAHVRTLAYEEPREDILSVVGSAEISAGEGKSKSQPIVFLSTACRARRC